MIHNCCNLYVKQGRFAKRDASFISIFKKRGNSLPSDLSTEKENPLFIFVYIVICFFTRPASGTTMMPANTTCITFPGMDPSGCIQLP